MMVGASEPAQAHSATAPASRGDDHDAVVSPLEAEPKMNGSGLVFFLTAPGELEAESFKPTTTHVFLSSFQ